MSVSPFDKFIFNLKVDYHGGKLVQRGPNPLSSRVRKYDSHYRFFPTLMQEKINPLSKFFERG